MLLLLLLLVLLPLSCGVRCCFYCCCCWCCCRRRCRCRRRCWHARLAIIGTAREAAGQGPVVLDVVVVRLFEAANALALRLELANQVCVVSAGPRHRHGCGGSVGARLFRADDRGSSRVEASHEETVLVLSELNQAAGGLAPENT